MCSLSASEASAIAVGMGTTELRKVAWKAQTAA
jgi:hypothetical protein